MWRKKHSSLVIRLGAHRHSGHGLRACLTCSLAMRVQHLRPTRPIHLLLLSLLPSISQPLPFSSLWSLLWGPSSQPSPPPVEHCTLHPDLLAAIRRDLEPWRQEGISVSHMRRNSWRCPEWDQDVHHTCNAFLRLTVQDGTLYLNSLVDRSPGMQPYVELPGQLLDLYETSLRYRLPDVDFTLVYGDEPPRQHGLPPAHRSPLFAAWKGDVHVESIAVPNAGHLRCSKDGVDAWVRHHLRDLEHPPWEERKSIAYARHSLFCPHWIHEGLDAEFPPPPVGQGGPIPCPRTTIDALSANHTDVLDTAHGHGPPLLNYTQFRYLVSTDGFSATNKLEKFLMMGSLVLKQQSQRRGWYYAALKPMVHYVPFYVNRSDDILEMVEWARANDAQARAIGQAARELVLSTVARPARLCFWKTLLEHYARLLRYKPSCRLHRMCVPAIQELTYLGHHETWGERGKLCRLHDQIDEMHGQQMPRGEPGSEDWGGPNTTFGHSGWALHEDNRTLAVDELVPVLLLLASLLVSAHAFVNFTNYKSLIEELQLLPEESCMSIAQLQEVVAVATYHTTVGPHESPRKAVVLTSCNVGCMKELFEPFMWSIEHNKDGDFSRHVIVVGNGLSAYLYCDSLRHKHKHHCVLDRMCAPPNAGDLTGGQTELSFGKPMYFFSLLQKITWAAEVIKLGVSVLWTDMDITYFGNPLAFHLNVAPDADMIVQTEYWDAGNVFTGDVCKFTGPDTGCVPGTKENPSTHVPGICCGMAINGGQWLINPTLNGIALIQAWAAYLFEDSIVKKKLWDGSAMLDQYALGSMIWLARDTHVSQAERSQVLNVSLYEWNATSKEYVKYGQVMRSPDENIYRTSAFKTQSHCFSECGWMGDNIGYNWYTRADGVHVCVQPKRVADRLLSLHQNCYGDVVAKGNNMRRWMNWTYDEARYEEEKATQHRHVFPDWEDPATQNKANQ